MVKKQSIGILTFPISSGGVVPLSNLISIIVANLYEIYLITGNEGYVHFNNDNRIRLCYGVKYKGGISKIKNFIKHWIIQLKLTHYLLKLNKYVDTWAFFIGADTLILPMLAAKLTKKKVLYIRAGSALETVLSLKENESFMKKPISWILISFGCVLISLITKINLYLSDCIIVYSSIFIKHWNLEKYIDKVMVCSEHFIYINDFVITKKYDERPKMVGYVGRLSGEKGVFNLVEAMSLLSDCDFKLIIIGDGNLRSEIVAYNVENNLNEKITLTGWISHDKLPDYLNQLKLLVLPSYTEGLPNIMLEAMACGTPVLATPVGAIPDVIKDGETGFLLKDNSPECIAESILKVLDMPDDKLEQVSENARRLVEREFTFENVVEKWGSILESI